MHYGWNRQSSKKGLCSFYTVFFLNLAMSVVALAGGMEVPDLGAVAIGRGAAFTARADNLSAFYYNPAGLTKSKGHNVLLGANIANVSIEYLRLGESKPVTLPNGTRVYNPDKDYYWFNDPRYMQTVDYITEENQNPIGPVPMLIYNWGDAFRVEGLALSLGLITPSSFGMPKYPEVGAQRYVLQEANQLIVYPGIGVAYAVNRYIQIGATFLFGIADIKMKRAVRLEAHTAPADEFLSEEETYNENWGQDIGFDIHVRDVFMPTASFGVMSNPLDWLELGVTVRLPVYIRAKGKVTGFEPPAESPDIYLKSGHDDLSLNLLLPLTLRAGARYIHRYFDIEVDFVWEQWSSLQTVKLSTNAQAINPDPDGNREYDQLLVFPEENEVPMHFRDSYSVRLGGDYIVWPNHIELRAGGYFQSSAYPKNYDTFSLFAPWGEQYGVGGGLTWHASKYIDVNLSYLRVIQRTVILRRGIVQQMAKLSEDADGEEIQVGNIVNSGRYTVGANLFGVSLEGHF